MATHMEMHCRDAASTAFKATTRLHHTVGGFVSLSLGIGDDEVTVFLPAHAYQAALSIAGLWPSLGKPGNATPMLSAEARALVDQTRPISEAAE